MNKSLKKSKHSLFVVCFLLLTGLAGCSSDSSTSTSSGALPQPSVNCGGNSCVN